MWSNEDPRGLDQVLIVVWDEDAEDSFSVWVQDGVMFDDSGPIFDRDDVWHSDWWWIEPPEVG